MRRSTITRSGADPASKAEKRRSATNFSPAIRIALPAEFAVSGISREPYRPETEAPPPFALSWSLPRRLRPSATYRIRWRGYGRSRSAPRPLSQCQPTPRAELFSQLPSYGRNCQCNWFPQRRNRDGKFYTQVERWSFHTAWTQSGSRAQRALGHA